MILKDQASKLREMMKFGSEGQQGLCIPVAILSCGCGMGEETAEYFAKYMAEKDKKKVLYINTKSKQKDIQSLVEYPFLYEQIEPQLHMHWSAIEDNMNEIENMLVSKNLDENYIKILQKIEQHKEVLAYYCGNFINAKAMNLIALGSSIILIVEETEVSFEMALQVLQIQRKIQSHIPFYLVGKDMDEAELQNIVYRLQKEGSPLLDEHIEGIGTVSFEKIRQGDIKEHLYIPYETAGKSLSNRILGIR